MAKATMTTTILLCMLLTMITSKAAEVEEFEQWCVADGQVPDDVVQAALDWACATGADCSMIQENRPCYLPNTVKDHASFAFNSYWQKFKSQGASCYFNAAAITTESDPSHGACKFEYAP